MRLRFSLRCFLAAVVPLVAVAVYLFVVRPTSLAERFVAAIKARDYDAAQSMVPREDAWIISPSKHRTQTIFLIYAEVMPRDWRDVWMCQRRIIYRVGFRDNSYGRLVEWTEDNDLVARSFGLDVIGNLAMPKSIPLDGAI
jgi:hypothetical protein